MSPKTTPSAASIRLRARLPSAGRVVEAMWLVIGWLR